MKTHYNNSILISFLLFLLIFSAVSLRIDAASSLVRSIEIRGLEKVPEKTVRSVIALKEGQPKPADYSSAIRSIFSLGYFANVEALEETTDGEVRVIFQVKENPVISKIGIVGARLINENKLRSSLSLEEGDICPTGYAKLVREAIAARYYQKDFYFVDVRVSRVDLTEGTCMIQIVIDEGEHIPVRNIIFKGNRAFSDHKLKKYILTRESFGWGKILAYRLSLNFFKGRIWPARRYYDEETFNEDLLRLKTFYNHMGYFDAQVARGEVIKDEKKNQITPVFIIEEGHRYRLSSITITGATVFSEAELREFLRRFEGEYFSLFDLYPALKKIYGLYQDEGYLLCRITPEQKDINKDVHTVDLDVNINEGARMRVGKIDLRRYVIPEEELADQTGIERWYKTVVRPPTKKQTIVRELLLKPGHIYRQFEEVRSEQRLRRLGIFESVQILRRPTKEEGVMDAVVEVGKEMPTRILLGAGFGDVSGGFVTARINERNFRGEAKNIGISFLLGTEAVYADLTYFDWHFLGSDTTFRTTIYRNLYYHNGYSEQPTGLRTEFGFPLSEYTRLYLQGKGEYIKFDEIDDDVVTEFDDYWVGSVRAKLFYDKRDEPFWPTKGYTAGGSVEGGYADGTLIKFEISGSSYINFYKHLIFASRLGAGVLPYDRDEIGITERFFLGGTESLRGFEYRGAGPKDSGDDDLALGGSTRLFVQNELRFNIYENLKGVLFVDLGTIEEDPFRLGDLRVSAGAGLRLNLPIFHISLDFAKALVEKDEDKTTTLHFKLGTDF